MEFKHISVLFNETIDGLNLKENGIYVDGTLGGGGHSLGMLSRGKNISLIGIDQDSEAIEASKKRLADYSERVTFVNDNFSNIKQILQNHGIEKIDGMMMDLGVSSYQLDNAERGFSYMHDSRLDMRMDRDSELSAYEIVNGYSKEDLTKIFYEYGEEKWSTRIAQFITDRRKKKPIETTFELVEIIKAAIPQKARESGSHPAKRVFQAIRIEVNNELGILDNTISDIVDCLNPGGRIAVITFHSLEDRIVKQAFAKLAAGCICPKNFPVCVCNKQPAVKIITKKPILPSEEEENENSRSKSAKLRIAEKI
ncbi:MAG: 16S rRNA (cytosine(1402)-N(4))-methyltransferase RsmH [Clostridia bacterium]|nr:16S rRNA (cytosine(1402)-N(4))-methyltransferase RsmH [Clostridia bacterium]